MAFEFSKTLSQFLLKGMNVSSTQGMVIVCIVMAGATLLLEFLKYARLYLHARSKLKQRESSVAKRQEGDELIQPQSSVDPLLSESTEWSCAIRLAYVGLESLFYLLQVLTAYILMLAVMSYNAWLLVSVTIASCLCYFIFGALRQHYWTHDTTTMDKAKPDYGSASDSQVESVTYPESTTMPPPPPDEG